MAAWPSDLPQKPLVQGFAETEPQLAARTAMDVGPAKVRRRATAGVTQIKCAFRLSTAQRASLISFWQTTLAGGSLSYSWTHPVSGSAISCRVVDPPEFTPVANGAFWQAALINRPFELTLPDDVEGRTPQAQLLIDNTSQELIALLRG